MNFSFTEEQNIFRKSIRDFARKEIKPLVEEAEETETFPIGILTKMGKLAYLGIGYPEKYGGTPAGKVMQCILAEELGRVNSGITSGIFAHSHLGVMPICEFGSEKQRIEYVVPALQGEKIAAFAATEPNTGSDVRGIQTTAHKVDKTYVINGSKIFITNGTICDYVLVCAYTDRNKGIDGLNIFVVDKNTPGFIVKGHLKKAGNRSSDTAELIFEDCIVSESKRIGNNDHIANFRDIMRVMSTGRMVIGARGVGLAQAALEAGISYAKQRVAFDKPISKHQIIAFRLAEMATELDLARLYVYLVLENPALWAGLESFGSV